MTGTVTMNAASIDARLEVHDARLDQLERKT